MNFGLDSLVKNLSNNDLKHLSEEFSGDLSKLVKQKGVYPYEYTDSFKKIFKDKLFDKCNFFSSLNDECIGKKDYQRATHVWNMFKMNTISDYHDFYLKADVLSLADVFQKFISTRLHYYGLDSCHYFSSPGLSWDALLKMAQTLIFIYLLKKELEVVFIILLKDMIVMKKVIVLLILMQTVCMVGQ